MSSNPNYATAIRGRESNGAKWTVVSIFWGEGGREGGISQLWLSMSTCMWKRANSCAMLLCDLAWAAVCSGLTLPGWYLAGGWELVKNKLGRKSGKSTHTKKTNKKTPPCPGLHVTPMKNLFSSLVLEVEMSLKFLNHFLSGTVSSSHRSVSELKCSSNKTKAMLQFEHPASWTSQIHVQ